MLLGPGNSPNGKALQTENSNVILPILHNLTIAELKAKWPIETERFPISSSQGIPANPLRSWCGPTEQGFRKGGTQKEIWRYSISEAADPG
jgi:hypothetical protein